MNVWILSDGEPLPVQNDGRRFRSWMLADGLAARGHHVVWWASTFSHHRKRLLFDRDADVEVNRGLRLKLLACGAYSGHASVRRYLHHRRLGTRFRDVAGALPPPDVIVCHYGKIDLSFHALRYGRRHRVPVIIDVRDLWPATYLDMIPRPLRRLARVAFASDFRRARAVFRGADSLVSMSSGVLKWAKEFGARADNVADRVFYIGYQGEIEHDDAAPPAYLDAAGNATVFAYVGAFGGSYELDTICAVASRLHAAGRSDIQFVLGGDGPRRAQVAKRVAGLTNVRLPGWLDHAGAKRLLARADVGLVPWNSVRDAMPNKVFEYLAAGLPLLSSLEGEMEDLLAEWPAGLAYRAGDVDRLEQLVVHLADNAAARREMATMSRRLFRARFRSDEIYADYARHVEQMATTIEPEQSHLAARVS
jgi:glycosyltransferase involved in cell wall biosynthesis